MFPGAIMAAGCYGGVAGTVKVGSTSNVLVGVGDTVGVDSVSYTIGANAWPTGVIEGGKGGVAGTVAVASIAPWGNMDCCPVTLTVRSERATRATTRHVSAIPTNLVMVQSLPEQAVLEEVRAAAGIHHRVDLRSPKVQTRDVRSQTRFVWLRFGKRIQRLHRWHLQLPRPRKR